MQKRPVLLVAAATAALLGILAALVGAAVVVSGVYDVSAAAQHLQPTYSLLEEAMRRSVKLRARDIAEPPLADERLALRGAACFRDKCVQCHGAPGVAQGDIGKGMQPLPGPLVDARQRWRARELYWLTKHGIKMSGMPAWEFRLREEDLWDVVAFMQRLPDLNAAHYTQWLQEAGAASCGPGDAPSDAAAPVSLERGRRALQQYACSACHMIPGITGAEVHVGPPLAGIASRRLIAGTLANTPENLERWLVHTQQVKPGTAMPQLGVTQRDARDMAGYLGELR